jgi:hypothetical protein
MKTSLLSPAFIFLSLTFFSSGLRAEDHLPARPGTLNYVEGQVYLGTQTLNATSVGTVELYPGQTLTTQNGKAPYTRSTLVFTSQVTSRLSLFTRVL